MPHSQPFPYPLVLFLQLQISSFNAKSKIIYQKNYSKTMLLNLNMSQNQQNLKQKPYSS